MRIRRIVLLAALGLLAAAVPAQASFHLMRVNEVMLSTGGDATAQFVELIDPVDEPFPSSTGPYKVVVYDANGTRLGAHTISTALLQGRDNTQPLLISTPAADAALGVVGDETLDVALPAVGQLCYTAGSSEGALDCVAWGCIASAVSSSVERVPAPPDGQSVQRQGATGSAFQLAQPTPKAANTAGTTAQPCTGSGTPSNAFSVKGTKALKNGSVAVTVKVAGPGKVSAKDAGPGKARFKAVKVSAKKAGTVTLTLKPSSAARKQIAAKGKLKVKVLLTFAPTGGKPASHTTHVTFKKPKP
ncbi:MAG: hypothetical protein QOE38_855 [Thermoleophilaceae bacterium]|nr:hypothetical protein [Thermoleophilaceae bacterium]